MALTMQLYDTYLCPATNALLDLGSDAKEWKDIYIDGIAYIDQLNMEGILDMADNDITSINSLYGIDSDVYIDLNNDGYVDIHADTEIRIFNNINFIFCDGDLVSYENEVVFHK